MENDILDNYLFILIDISIQSDMQERNLGISTLDIFQFGQHVYLKSISLVSHPIAYIRTFFFRKRWLISIDEKKISWLIKEK